MTLFLDGPPQALTVPLNTIRSAPQPGTEEPMSRTDNILALLEQNAPDAVTLDAVEAAHGGSREAARVTVNKLVRAGKAERTGRGEYRLASGAEADEVTKEAAEPDEADADADEDEDEANDDDPEAAEEDEQAAIAEEQSTRPTRRLRLVVLEVEGDLGAGELERLLAAVRR